MPAQTVVFANNRGGLGKSTAVYQLSAARAAAQPGKKVLVLDLSVHADASTLLLGGTQEPSAAGTGARTRGAQALAALPPAQTAAGLLQELLERDRNSSTLTGRMSGLFTGTKPVDVAAHACRVADHAEGAGAPANLWLCAGGAGLARAVGAEEWARAAVLLREALQALGEGEWLVFVDTDAELAERMCSKVGLAVADKMVLLLSASWNDYCRTLDDPINGLFGVLGALEEQGTPVPCIEMVMFNHVKQKERAPIKLHSGDSYSRDATLPFSPVKGVQAQMSQISDHLYDCGWQNIERDWKRFFVDADAVTDPGAFSDRYVTALLELPETVSHASQLTGNPICCMDPKAVYLAGTPGEFKVSKDTLEKCRNDVLQLAERLQ